jgi:hypothetical protein
LSVNHRWNAFSTTLGREEGGFFVAARAWKGSEWTSEDLDRYALQRSFEMAN